MMKKKVLSMMLCVAMTATVLAGCGSKEATAEAPAETEASEETEAVEETEAEETEASEEADAAEETTGGVLVMATNAEFPPYEYYEGQEVVGIDAEMAAAVAEKLGMELKIEDMAFDSIITAVSSGKADIGVAGMTVTEDRLKNIDFSDSYATATQAIIVKEDSEIASADDLTGKRIGVQLGTTGDIYASDVEGADIQQFNKGMEAVMALSQDKLDAVIIDNEPAKVFVSETSGLKILDEAFAVEDYAIAIAKGNEDLLDKVNAALAELKEDGTLQAIVDKYITAE
jgi:polar amino acid transport system substrate-binding protein